VIKTPEKEEKVETPLIDFTEKAMVKLVHIVFAAARTIVKELKELIRN